MERTKQKLDALIKIIETQDVSDDELKKIGDALAEKIAKGQAAPRVGTKVGTAVRKAFKRRAKREPKPVNNFERLKKHALSLAEGLQFWADGTMKPETEDEAIAAKIVMDAAPSILVHYSRLGLNILKIYDTFIDPKRRECQRLKLLGGAR
ncbi:MAG: hypothetical protein JRJ75_16675 [Deltaproteobacteria bacterium]|nr:hypothetical protein [Deltaproteobacteria bacterium]